MRRSATIALILVLILAIAGSTYAYVANQRQWWPFSTTFTSSPVNNSGFTDLIAKDTAVYVYLDLANQAVQSNIPANSELAKNIATLKGGLQQFGNFIVHSNTAMALADDPSKQQEVETKIAQAIQYFGNKKIHVSVSDPVTPTTTVSSTTPNIIIGFENASPEEARDTLVTLKGLMTEDNRAAQIADLQMSGIPVTEISATTSTPTAAFAPQSTAIPESTTKMSTYIATIGNNITVVTANKAAMETLIQKSLQPSLDSLKNNPQFATLASKINGPQLAVMYLNTPKYVTALNSMNLQTSNPEAFQKLIQSPIYDLNTIIGLTLNDKGIYSEAFSMFNNPQVAAAFNTASSSNAAYAGIIPDDTLIFAEGNNLTQQLSLALVPLLQTLENDPALADQNPIDALHAFEDATHISLQGDIAPLFTKNTTVIVHRIESVLTPVALSILTQVDDSAKAESTMKKITEAIGTQIEAMLGVPLPAEGVENTDNLSVHTYGSLNGSDTIFNYTTFKDLNSLVISTAKSGISKLAQTMHSPEKTLARSAKLPALLKGITNFTSRSYIDIKGIADTFLPLVRISLDPESGTKFDNEVKPYIDSLNNIASYSMTDNGLLKSVTQVQLVK